MSDHQAVEEARLDATQRQLLLQAMSLEYSSLRQEIAERGSRRFSTFTLVIAAAAAVTAASGADSTPFFLAISGLALLFVASTALHWLYGGRVVGRLGNHLSHVERRINDLVVNGHLESDPLQWELANQVRRRQSRLHRMLLGAPAAPRD